jgi:uncharacterized protein (TIGR02268 family)
MTNFIFDARAEVELQDEARFAAVSRGRNTVSILPPRDMAPGERLRFTALLGDGKSQQSVTFLLVAHSGQATRQVEVYRDQRTPESYQQELAQERAKYQRLREELERMRVQLERSGGLRGLIASKVVSKTGVQTRLLKAMRGPLENGLFLRKGFSYRTDQAVALELWVANFSSEPWMTSDVSLVDARGNELQGLKLRQDSPIAPGSDGLVLLELAASRKDVRGELTVTLGDGGARSIAIPRVVFP